MAQMVKNPPANAGDTGGTGSIPGSERSPGEGQGNPLQYSCLGNSMDRGACRTTVLEVTKESDTTEHLTAQFDRGEPWKLKQADTAQRAELEPRVMISVSSCLVARLLCPWDFPGEDTGVGCHFLLQGTVLTQGSNLGLLNCRRSPPLRVDSSPTEPPGKPLETISHSEVVV